MKVLLSGTSSFTGLWFSGLLADRGHEVVAILTRPLADYEGLRATRLTQLLGRVDFRPQVLFGSREFLGLLSEGEFDVVCAHGAMMDGYRSPDFPYLEATKANTAGVEECCRVLSEVKRPTGLVLTGTVFEAREGIGDPEKRAFSPYGLSKTLTSDIFSFFSSLYGVPLTKFVIPNPFGPYEEKRFLSHLITNWFESKVPEVRTPEYLRDNIAVDLLAMRYVNAVETSISFEGQMTLRPSGYVESQGTFSYRVAREISKRTGWDCPLQINRQVDFSEPMFRVNDQPASSEVPEWNEELFWDAYTEYYLKILR